MVEGVVAALDLEQARLTLLYRRTPEGGDYRGSPRPGAVEDVTSARGAWGLIYEFCSQTMHSVTQVIEHLDSVSGSGSGAS